MWQQWDFGDCWLPFERIQGCKKGIRSSSCGAWLERSIWGLLAWCLWQVFLFIGICWDRHKPRTEKKTKCIHLSSMYIYIHIYVYMYTYVDIQWDICIFGVSWSKNPPVFSALSQKGGKRIFDVLFRFRHQSSGFFCLIFLGFWYLSIPWYPRINTWENGNVITAMMTRRLQQCQVPGKRWGHQVDGFWQEVFDGL